MGVHNKQSVKQIYLRGSGKDCRLHVMKLNKYQFSDNEINEISGLENNNQTSAVLFNSTPSDECRKFSGVSKWSAFIDDIKENISSDDENKNELSDAEITCQRIKRKTENYHSNKNGNLSDHSFKKVQINSVKGNYNKIKKTKNISNIPPTFDDINEKSDNHMNITNYGQCKETQNPHAFIPSTKSKSTKTESKWLAFLENEGTSESEEEKVNSDCFNLSDTNGKDFVKCTVSDSSETEQKGNKLISFQDSAINTFYSEEQIPKSVFCINTQEQHKQPSTKQKGNQVFQFSDSSDESLDKMLTL